MACARRAKGSRRSVARWERARADELPLPFRLARGAVRHHAGHELFLSLPRQPLGFARARKRVVLCIDESQSMPLETLETLRLLTNLETEKRKLLQVVLFGQPELDHRLRSESIRQLRQRIVFEHRLQGLAD